MCATVEQHVAATIQPDEYQIVHAGQAVAGPVRCVRPACCAGATVPADAAAQDAAEADAEAVAVHRRRVACCRDVYRRKRSADAVSGGDQGGRQRPARVGRIFRNRQRAAERDRTGDGELVVGAGSAAAYPQIELASTGLHEVAGHAQRAVLEGAQLTRIGQRAAGADVYRAVAEDVAAAGDGEAADAAQRGAGSEVGVAVVGQRAADFESRTGTDVDEAVVGEGATAGRAAVADVEAQPAGFDANVAIVGEVDVIGGAARNAQAADRGFADACRLDDQATGTVDHRHRAGAGPAVAEIEIPTDVEAAVVRQAAAADDVDVTGTPVQRAVVYQRTGTEALVGAGCGVIASGRLDGQRRAVLYEQVALEQSARPAAAARECRQPAAAQRAAGKGERRHRRCAAAREAAASERECAHREIARARHAAAAHVQR